METDTEDKNDWHFIKGAAVERDNSGWSFTDGSNYSWRNEVRTNFWSVYPEVASGRSITYPGDRASDDEQTRITVAYTMPIPCTSSPYRDAENQPDLCFAYNNKTWSDGEDNKVDIEFHHALSAVYFRIDGVTDAAVERIGFNGILSEGECDITGSAEGIPTFVWRDQAMPACFMQDYVNTDFTGTVKVQPFTGTDKIYMFIPQTLSSGAEIRATFRLADNTTVTRSVNVSTYDDGTPVEWKPGKKYLYRISKDGASYDFRLSDPAQASLSFSNTTSPATTDVDVSSTKNGITPVNWFIKSYRIGTAAAVDVNAASFTDKGGLTVMNDAGTLKVTALARTPELWGGNDYWRNQNPVRTTNLDWSPADWTSVTESAPIDLSKFDFRTESARAMTTANCYIIRHAGTYRIPLVYGNGVVNGVENTGSYYPNAIDGTNRLERFVDHRGNGITSAFIENNGNLHQAVSCDVLWQDEASVIGNLSIEGDIAGTYTKDNVRYLQFTVDKRTVCQNNAVIAVRDANGDIMWSWHIWTTNDPALLSEAIPVTNHDGNVYSFFPISCLGWVEGLIYLARERVVITLEQVGSNHTVDVIVDQPVVREPANGCYYQFGRKDPMCRKNSPATGWFTISSTATQVDLKTSILTPGIFYKGSGDWCSTLFNNLWTGKLSVSSRYQEVEANITKTVYDPSPTGYKMPASRVFTGFTTTGEESHNKSEFNVPDPDNFSQGWDFYTSSTKTDTIFFAAAGNRLGFSGSIMSIGSYAYYYTALSGTTTAAFRMHFDSSHLDLLAGVNKGSGGSVRPVLE